MSGNAKAKVLKVVSNGTTYLHIKFYTDNETETYAEVGCVLLLSLLSLTLLRQFIAEDPVRMFSPISSWLDEIFYSIAGRDGWRSGFEWKRQGWQLGGSRYWQRQRNHLQEEHRIENYGHSQFDFQESDHGLFWEFRR